MRLIAISVKVKIIRIFPMHHGTIRRIVSTIADIEPGCMSWDHKWTANFCGKRHALNRPEGSIFDDFSGLHLVSRVVPKAPVLHFRRKLALGLLLLFAESR
jgi:hypothetical protein